MIRRSFFNEFNTFGKHLIFDGNDKNRNVPKSKEKSSKTLNFECLFNKIGQML